MHHLVGNAEEAEDLAQEVFLRVYRARKKYRPRSKFSTWLFTIANNLALNSLRGPAAQAGGAAERAAIPVRSGPRPAEQLVQDRDSGPMQHVQQQELAGDHSARPWTDSTNGSAWPSSSTSSRT